MSDIRYYADSRWQQPIALGKTRGTGVSASTAGAAGQAAGAAMTATAAVSPP